MDHNTDDGNGKFMLCLLESLLKYIPNVTWDCNYVACSTNLLSVLDQREGEIHYK